MLRKVLAGLFVIGVLAGCSSTPENQAQVEDRSVGQQPGPGGPGASTSGVGGGTPGGSTSPGGSTGPGGSTAGTGAGTGPGASGTGTSGGGNPLTNPANILSRRTVFFDFDSFIVKDEFRPVVQAHAKYLNDNRNARMKIQGHTDERGTREYNIALGQRRADAVKRMMLAMGVAEAQIETVSFGKEKPKNTESSEAGWAENRRSEFVYQGE